ncbi:MAG: hypothetical protein FWE20_08445 [Defluviitaleaceae bacterium]|nr:hypothetical protein [Defluviitaleaceae bacterium]
MINLVYECHDFFKNCGFTYAICGGFALELFINRKIRPHSDLDISIFDEDRKNIVEFMLSHGWRVYEHPSSSELLGIILSPDDKRVLERHCLWAIKPDCSFINIEPTAEAEGFFKYEITNEEQLNFDFIEIIFNSKSDTDFLCGKDKNIKREMDKAILYSDGIPYLAPEILLLITS